MVYLWVGVAGAVGAILRYSLGVLFFSNGIFPYATLSINLIGSFLLAWLTNGLFKRTNLSSVFTAAIGTGFVGSFTTFSTLSIETVELFQRGRFLLGVIYVLISIFGGLFMSRLGFKASMDGGKS